VSGNDNGIIKVWNSTTGIVRLNLNDYTSPVYALIILSDNKIVSGDLSSIIRVWDLVTASK
jgi:WD40 repeat protein